MNIRAKVEIFYSRKKKLISTNKNKFIYLYFIYFQAKSGKELVAFLTNDFLLFAQPLKTLPTGQQFSFERNENNKFKLYRKV